MKLKILLTPVLLILNVALAIWVLNPAYKDMQAKKAVLTAEAAKLTDIKEKNAKAETAYGVWNGNPEKRSIIMTYVPAQEQEEEVIDNLNSLVSASGLGLYDLSIGEVEKAKAPDETISDENGNLISADTGPAAENFHVVVGVSGDYAKIKTFLAKADALKRFNSISKLEIFKASSKDGSAGQEAVDNGTNGNLQANIIFNFNWLDTSSIAVTLDNKVFVANNFDMTVADEINKQLTIGVQALNVGLTGRENPFIK